MVERPASVNRALQLLAVITAGVGLFALLTWVFEDDLVLAWAEGNPGARLILAEGGIAAVEENLAIPGFVAVVVTSFITYVMLVWVFAAFFKGGFRWGQICLAVVALFGIFLGALVISSGVPPLFDVASVLMALFCASMLWFLVHPDTMAFLSAEPDDSNGSNGADGLTAGAPAAAKAPLVD